MVQCGVVSGGERGAGGGGAALGGRLLQVLDLFDQVGLLVIELLVVHAVLLEVVEEVDEFGLVLEQDVDDGLRLVGVGHKHLVVVEEEGVRRTVRTVLLIGSLEVIEKTFVLQDKQFHESISCKHNRE